MVDPFSHIVKPESVEDHKLPSIQLSESLPLYLNYFVDLQSVEQNMRRKSLHDIVRNFP